ncbi:unnamed protein product [Phytomonas sp. Hart1]|nr:unnamed protein product [Phytomonas sp. Hart1]|eukprot:CCW66326.1 unnamed protein product [Phytomonas sp. isolate Hart1]
MSVPVSFVCSVDDFRRIFYVDEGASGIQQFDDSPGKLQHSPPSDSLLLFYESGDAGVSADGISAFQQQVESSAMQHGAEVRLFLWYSTNNAFIDAKEQLFKRKGFPLLVIVFRRIIADSFRDLPLDVLTKDTISRICERLALYQGSKVTAHIHCKNSFPFLQGENDVNAFQSFHNHSNIETQTLSVDVVQIIEMGKNLLCKDRADYAEKCFVKALKILDALKVEVCKGERTNEGEADFIPHDYTRSVAYCIAWAAIAQLVQGKEVLHNAFIERLTGGRNKSSNVCEEGPFFTFTEEPLSDECRACALHRLLIAAPLPWIAATCSERKLQEILNTTPTDHARRAQLIITLFLRGDIERALTEAARLHSLRIDFGRVALKEISRFLGSIMRLE